MKTEKCIVCLSAATLHTCHVLKGKNMVCAGWCDAHKDNSEDWTKMTGPACFGKWKPEYGLTDFWDEKFL